MGGAGGAVPPPGINGTVVGPEIDHGRGGTRRCAGGFHSGSRSLRRSSTGRSRTRALTRSYSACNPVRRACVTCTWQRASRSAVSAWRSSAPGAVQRLSRATWSLPWTMTPDADGLWPGRGGPAPGRCCRPGPTGRAPRASPTHPSAYPRWCDRWCTGLPSGRAVRDGPGIHRQRSAYQMR